MWHSADRRTGYQTLNRQYHVDSDAIIWSGCETATCCDIVQERKREL